MAQSPASAVTPTRTTTQNHERFFQTGHLKTDLKGRTVRNSALTVTSQAIRQALSIGSAIVLARLLTPQDYGLVGMVVVVVGFIDLFNEMGFSEAIIQRPEIDQQLASTLYWINIVIGFAMALLTIALAPVLAWFYNEPRLTLITMVVAIRFVLGSLSVPHRALLKRQMRFAPIAVITVISSLADIGVGIGAALAGFGYWSLVFMMLASAPIETLGIWIVFPWRPSWPRRVAGVRSMLAFGGNLTGFRTVDYFARNLDNLLIGRFFGPQQLGLYAKAYGLLLLPLDRINSPVTGVAVPALSRLTDSPDRYRRAYTRIVASLCLFTMPLVAFMIGTADWIVLVLLGPRWVEAGRIFALLGISGLIEPFTYTASWLFVSQARTRQQFHWGIISTALTVIAILAGLPWGAAGVALAYGVSGLCIRTPLLFWFVGRTGPVRTADLYFMAAPFASAAVVTLAAVLALRFWAGINNPLIGVMVAAGLTALVSLATLACFSIGRQALRDLRSIPALLAKRS